MIAFSAGEVTQPARVLYEVTPPHGGCFGPMLGLKRRNGKQASQYLSGQRGERDTGASGTHRPFQPRDKRADGDHRGELNTRMRTAAVSAVATRPSPLKCPPFLAPKRRQARISKRSDMSATSRKSVSGATRAIGQRPSPKNTAVLKTPSAPPMSWSRPPVHKPPSCRVLG